MPTYSESYLKTCDYCADPIRMSVVPNGTWQPFDVEGGGRHQCDARDISAPAAREDWSLTTLGHPLTFRTQCWWCDETVFFHTNGNGDCVLFDRLGWPWTAHACWRERAEGSDRGAARAERHLRDRGYRGIGHFMNINPSDVPEEIPSQARAYAPNLCIRLSSMDTTHIDAATRSIVKAAHSTTPRIVAAVPLPAKRVTYGMEGQRREQRRHRRRIEVWEASPHTIACISEVQVAGSVDIEILQAM